MNLSSFADADHLLVKFRGTSDVGNNIYIDDIQISGPLGVEALQNDFSFSVSPNPMTEQAQVDLEVVNAGNYGITISDVTGKLVATIYSGALSFGNHRFDVNRQQIRSAGVYFIQVETGLGREVTKLVVQ